MNQMSTGVEDINRRSSDHSNEKKNNKKAKYPILKNNENDNLHDNETPSKSEANIKNHKKEKFFPKKIINETDNSREEGFTHFKEDYKDIKASLIFNKELEFEIEKEFRSFIVDDSDIDLEEKKNQNVHTFFFLLRFHFINILIFFFF